MFCQICKAEHYCQLIAAGHTVDSTKTIKVGKQVMQAEIVSGVGEVPLTVCAILACSLITSSVHSVASH